MILKERVMEMNRNLIRTSLLMIFMSIPVGYSNVVFAEAPVYSLDPVYVVGAHKVLDSDKFGNIITEQSLSLIHI